jgi:alpha-glucosidase
VTAYHHDGSALHVSNPTPGLGETVAVFLRGLAGRRRVFVRSIVDGEPRFAEAVVDRTEHNQIWWRAPLVAHNVVTRYRFLIVDADTTWWFTAAGPVAHDVPDDTDFRIVAHPGPPAWAADAIVYEIFPDRFERSAAADTRPVPDWAIPCHWDAPVIGRGPETARQLYGGDLDGIAQRLDHVADLGANTVYLTPIFPARSNHRYDAASFDTADPGLGGDAALARLSQAIHERGMRLVGDITTNHTGDSHPWFTGPDRKELYYADEDGSYESWLGVSSLPKLDWTSTELRRRFFDSRDGVVAHWLQYFDGWRVDVANMTGRLRGDDVTHEVSRLMAEAVRAARSDGLLVAEHAHDAGGDLDLGGWHGTMNYAGFTRPVWNWLAPDTSPVPDFLGVPGGLRRREGRDVVATMRSFAARMSWPTYQTSWNMLESHDTPRLRTVIARDDLIEVAVALLATMPGTPMVFAGGEWGLRGSHGEASRTPMPWNSPQSWHRPAHDAYRSLLRLRADLVALRHGGLRFAHVDQDALAYWREAADSRVLVLLRREAGSPIRLESGELANVYGGMDVTSVDGTVTVPGDGPTVQIWRSG